MAKGKAPEAGGSPASEPQLRAMMLALEPELRRLRSVVTVLRYLSERVDPVEPLALAVLTAAGTEALDRIDELRRELEQGEGSRCKTVSQMPRLGRQKLRCRHQT